MRSTNESANEGVNEMLNRTVRLVSRPVGIPDDTTWAVADESMPAIAPGQFMVATEFLSLDPAMRGWVSTAKSYIPPVRIGSVMRAYGVGRVVESQHPSYAIGDTVSGPFGVSEYCVTDGFDVSRVDESVATLPTWLGALGFPGLTAYYGLFDVGKISPGDTVVISGAAGAVGHLAGQMAKIHGCTVIGIAGGKEKMRVVDGRPRFRRRDRLQERIGVRRIAPARARRSRRLFRQCRWNDSRRCAVLLNYRRSNRHLRGHFRLQFHRASTRSVALSGTACQQGIDERIRGIRLSRPLRGHPAAHSFVAAQRRAEDP